MSTPDDSASVPAAPVPAASATAVAVEALAALTDEQVLAVVAEVAGSRPALSFLASASGVPVGEVPPPVDAAPVGGAELGVHQGLGANLGGVTAEGIGYTTDGVPTYDSVREKIEGRFGTAVGAAELAHESAAGQSVDDKWEQREKAAKAKLDEIRRSMGQGGATS